MTYVLAVVLGVAAGVLAGMFGVGGGILFVPTLVALGLSQHDATGTSLLAIIPTALVGTWRQARYENVRGRAALVIGIAAAAAAQGGAAVAETLSGPTLRKLFAGLLVLVAVWLVPWLRWLGLGVFGFAVIALPLLFPVPLGARAACWLADNKASAAHRLEIWSFVAEHIWQRPIAASEVAVAACACQLHSSRSKGTMTIPPPTPNNALKNPATRPMRTSRTLVS